MSDISQWSQSAASNNSSPPNGFPEQMAPSGVNDAAREMMAAIARLYGDIDGTLVTGGAGNSYTLTSTQTFAALADQSILVFRIDRANSAAATLEVDSLGAKSMRVNGTALVSGQLVADTVVIAAYNSTDDAYDLLGAIQSAADLVGEIADARLSSNVPLIDVSNTFTGGEQRIEATSPTYSWEESDAGVDEKIWKVFVNNDNWRLATYTDANAFAEGVLTVGRTGTNVDSFAITADSITANGSEVLTPAEVAAATAIEGNALVGSDGFYVDDAGVAKRMSYQSAGVRVQTVSGTSDTLTDSDMNSYIITTNASAVTITLNTGVGVQGNVLLIKQGGAGQVSLAGTATFEGANGTKTSAQNSVIVLVNEGSDVWSVSGDAST